MKKTIFKDVSKPNNIIEAKRDKKHLEEALEEIKKLHGIISDLRRQISIGQETNQKNWRVLRK
jgi:short-subunit dehydrogenase involved in D-alanine esterification of teichoic acids